MNLKPIVNWRTVNVGVRANTQRGRDALVDQALSLALQAVGVAVQSLLAYLQQRVAIEYDDAGALQTVDLFIPLDDDNKVSRAQKLVGQDRPVAVIDKGPQQAARPRYTNSYRMEEIVTRDGCQQVRSRLAERFSWKPIRGPRVGQLVSAVDKIDATIGLQGLLNSWLPIDWCQVPSALRPGVCQQAAQQLNSYIGLLTEGHKASFPSLEDRCLEKRECFWHESLDRLVTGSHVLKEQQARDTFPGKYEEDDLRGDRLVVTDPDWVGFVRSPFPKDQALNFVKRTDVVIYRRSTDDRLYAALPLFTGVATDSPLGELGNNKSLRWWHTRTDEFTPLPLWEDQALSSRRNPLLVQLEQRHVKRFKALLSDGRKCNWSLITRQRARRTRRDRSPRWTLHLTTSREITPVMRSRVLGVHFGMEPVLWWVLMDREGLVIESGSLAHNPILTSGLAKQLKLQDDQGKQRWVGERRFAKDLSRRTDEVAGSIVQLAADHDANLSLEKISWVDKRRGGRAANQRHSLWNFGDLLKRIEWLGLERCDQSGQSTPVVTVCEVSDYVLRYTCPSCGACRGAKQTKQTATTWRNGENLECRACGYKGVVPDDHQASLVGSLGVAALLKRTTV